MLEKVPVHFLIQKNLGKSFFSALNIDRLLIVLRYATFFLMENEI